MYSILWWLHNEYALKFCTLKQQTRQSRYMLIRLHTPQQYSDFRIVSHWCTVQEIKDRVMYVKQPPRPSNIFHYVPCEILVANVILAYISVCSMLHNSMKPAHMLVWLLCNRMGCRVTGLWCSLTWPMEGQLSFPTPHHVLFVPADRTKHILQRAVTL